MIRPGGTVKSEVSGGRAVLECEEGVLVLRACRHDVLHVAWHPEAVSNLPMWGITAKADAELAWREGVEGERRILNAGLFTVRTGKPDAFLEIEHRKLNLPLVCRSAGAEKTSVSGEDTYRVRAAFDAPEGERYYGLGQHQLGRMDQGGEEVKLWHDYKAEGGEIIAIPFLVSSLRYGIVWDNVSRGTVTPGVGGLTSWQFEAGKAVSFFVIAGSNIVEVYEGYRFLTGSAPLPPMAALGYIQCRQRYRTRDELMKVARTYREKKYPCDILVLDWFHWKVLGDMDLDPEFWPDPAGMNRELESMGYRTMISCWPRFKKESAHYSALEERGWFMKDDSGKTVYGTPEDRRGALIDTTHPEAARWYWRRIHESYGRRGFSSWWLDENEPDLDPDPFYLHAGPGAVVHNLYPLAHCRAVYEGHRRDRGDRCLILSRSAYHGAQKYGTTFWSSDIHPTWDVYRRQIPTGLNFCASGMPYWSSDIGGWHALPGDFKEGADYKSLLLDTGEDGREGTGTFDYTELYIRWFQYGAFCPTFRAHGTRPGNEVWSFGADAEKILVKYLKLRYRLLPYIYSLAWRSRRTGAPFMRALFMDFPGDPEAADIGDEYMFGPAFLVAPVTEPGARERKVYLPDAGDGCVWYDYWSGKRCEGGRTIRAFAGLDVLPLFVRAGSVIPHGEDIPHTGIPQKRITLKVFEGKDGVFELYRDDGVSYGYERGEYSVTRLSWDDGAKAMAVEGDSEGLFTGAEGTWLERAGG
ncbi:MAG: glycoside hydrolase family 31 protein [Kiritimatiellia bacterium]